RRTVEAAKDVEQATVALCPLGTTGVFVHPAIAAPPFVNVTLPHSAVLLVPAVTVAIRVTFSFVTSAIGVTRRPDVVGCDATGIGDATTTAVRLELADVVPPAPVALTTQTIVLPTSAAERT